MDKKFEDYGFRPSAVIEGLNRWYDAEDKHSLIRFADPDGRSDHYHFYDHNNVIDAAIKYLRSFDIFYTPGMKWDDVKFDLNSRACLAEFGFCNVHDAWPKTNPTIDQRKFRDGEIRDYILKHMDAHNIKIPESFRVSEASVENLIAYLFALLMQERKNKEGLTMSIFENMDARGIAMCLSGFYEAAKKYTHAQLYSTQVYLPNREKPISIDRSDYDEGIKILREDYDVFWTPDTKPDDLKWKINKRWMKELQDRIAQNSWYGASSGVAFGPGCVVTGNDYLYRRELGLPDSATVADILGRIRELKWAESEQTKTATKLAQVTTDISKERDEADRLRRHWHAKYEDEHKESVRLSKLHAADKEKKNKQDIVIHNLSDTNTTLEYSVAALKKRIRSMETEAAEKETKNKVITDTLRDNLVDSVEECKRLKAKIRELDALYWNPCDTDNE